MRILVLHIPKTGGTAIAEYFRKIYGDNVFGVSHTPEIRESFELYKTEILNHYSFIQGHIPLASIKDHISNFDFIISVVRDPVSRLLSHFNYIKGNNFSEFLFDNYLNNIATRNEQCGYVGLNNTFSSVLYSLKNHPNLVLFNYNRLEQEFKKFCVKNNLGDGVLPRANVTKFQTMSFESLSNNRKDIDDICSWFSDDIMLHSYLDSKKDDYVTGRNL
jgi:hypothetical protein